jgi:hypothetical protein
MFDKYFVVTDSNDSETIELCTRFEVDCRLSDKTRTNGASFNKSGLIHGVQQELHSKYPRHWILVMDADIILPKSFPDLVSRIDPTFLYCMLRKDYKNSEDLAKDVYTIYDNSYTYPGYFQLYYRKNHFYPTFSKAGDICDFVFSHQFSRRAMLSDEVYVTHLGEPNRNVTGRFTERWR